MAAEGFKIDWPPADAGGGGGGGCCAPGQACEDGACDAPAPKLTKLHISGWPGCGYYRKAKAALETLSVLFPDKYEIVLHEQPDRDAYRAFLFPLRDQMANSKANSHTSSPFVAMGEDFAGAPGECTYVGGCDATLDYARSLFGGPTNAPKPAASVADGYAVGHEFDYDLIVIGGGSGGLAASKEAAKLLGDQGKVLVLDYVKPSPKGSKWGLGGTCVNVGCIPKKLMHQSSLIGELINEDAKHFGWVSPTSNGAAEGEGEAAPPQNVHQWETMRSEVQSYIKGLNFKYKVSLRDAKVKYVNGLGEFAGDHQMKITTFKGKAKTPKEEVVTFARALIATGGRPTPLSCPGGEHAISSDDLFSLEKSPGKTCIIGAGYVALECGGFLTALGCDTTIAVRSVLLRGFDRECCDKIGAFMEAKGTKFIHGATPTNIVPTDEGKYEVTFSNGSSDVFDTVMAATGRTADTAGLNLEAVGVEASPKNGKFTCVDEQTNVPHVYAIGDVLQGLPELTPVAIQAGIMLARRMFGGSSEAMDYKNIATAVFTPIEYGAIGLSEEEAIEAYGGANLEVYHSEFVPLEWSLSPERQTDTFSGFCKVICDKTANMKIVGMHYLGPNAGEVTQGYGVAMKKGFTFGELSETVGIHPTTSEVFTTLTVTKSSGASAAATGC